MVSSLYHAPLFAAIKGSTTAVSIEPSFEFLATDTDNIMQGFGWFKNGFTLQDNTTTCTFQSVYPVSGLIDLRGGTLHLLEDLILKNFTTLQGLGTIVGNNYLLEFCSSITSLPANTDMFQDLYVALSNSLELQGTTTFAGSTILDGRGHTLELGASGAMVVASGSTVTLRNILIKGVNADNIRCADDTATLVLDNVKWVQSGDVNFDSGSLYINDKVEFYGNHVFNYTSNNPITILKQSLWSLLSSIDLIIGKKQTALAIDPLLFEDNTSLLKLSNCSLLITGSGLHLKKGMLILDEEISIDMQSTNTTNGLIVGDGILLENDFSIRFNAGASVTHRGHTAYNNVDPHKLNALSQNAKIVREINSNIFMAKDITLPSMTFESVSNAVPPIQCADGATITYQDNQLLFPSAAFDITGRQEEANTFSLEGSHEIFFSKGSLPLNLIVSGTNNLMHGSGGVSGLLTLKDNGTELICSVQGPITQSPVLNGGTITLGADLVLGPDIFLTGSGTVKLSSCSLQCGSKDIVWTGSTIWQDTNGSIDMNAQISLTGMWTIEGQITIKGNSNTLDLSDGGNIVIAPGATLRCKDVRIKGISGTNIRCSDDSAALVLENVVWIQSDNFTFPNGSLSIVDQVDFVGSYTFGYESRQTSTIEQTSEWHITDEMRFEIGKNPTSNNWPLSFVDETSALHLDNCNYVITGSGIEICDGTIMYSGNVAIEIQSTNTTNGSFMGNGIAAHDPTVKFSPGATAHFSGGHLVWNVVDSTKLVSEAISGNIVRSNGNTYYIEQNLVLRNFTVTADASIVTNFAPGKNLTYSQCLFTLPNGQAQMTANRYNAYTSLLNGNNSIFLKYGTLPLATFVMANNNLLSGNGIITGPIVLLNSLANLTLSLAGSINSNITLSDGTIALGQDTNLTHGVIIADSGTVNLNSARLRLSSQDVVWPGTINWQSNGGTIDLGADVSLSGNWIFDNTVTLQGNGNVLDLSSGGTIQIAPGATLKLSNMRIRGIAGTNINCIDDTGRLVLDQVVWVQGGDFSFQHGSMTVNDNVDFLGSYTFTYSSKQSSIINEESTWHITDSMQFVMGKQPASDAQNPLLFTDVTSVLNLDNCSFIVTNSGWDLLKGCIQYSRNVTIDVLSTSTLNGVSLGDGTPNNDPLVLFDPGSNASFVRGHLIYNIVNTANLVSNSTTVQMARLPDSYFDIRQHIILKNFTIDASAQSVTVVEAGKMFKYENCIFVLPDGRAEINAYRYDGVSNLFTVDNRIIMRYGSMPMANFVQGTGNLIAGTGDVTGPIILLDSSATLFCGLSGSLESYVMLNGGTLSLTNDLQIKDTNAFTTIGTVNLDSFQLSLGAKDTVWTSTLVWNADEATIQMNAKVCLQGSWLFKGNCKIDGNGNILDLGKIGTITIGDGVQLTLRNMRLTGIIDNSFTWLGDTSALILDDVTWVQEGDFTLDKGSILFKDTVDFNGSYTFAIDTASTSTISVNSSWNIGDGMQLSLGRTTTNGSDPLYFADATSNLSLNNCIFNVTQYGMQFTRGHVLCSGDVAVDIQSTSTLNGLRLGDGTPAGNMIFEFNPGSNVSFLSGHAVYDITVPDSVVSRSTVAKLTRAAESIFYVNQNVMLENLTIDASMYAITNVADGKTFGYQNCMLILPTGSIIANALRYNAYTNLLAGNESIFLEAGANPMYTVVRGTGNYIIGNGSLTGQTVLLDAQAQLILAVDGLVNQDITLNGGIVVLGSDLKFAGDKQFVGNGFIELAGNQVTFGPQDSNWTGNIVWQGDGGQIDLNATVALASSWTFTVDTCVLHGHGNTIDLSDGGEIIVGSGATLHIKDAEIKGIQGTNIRCMSDTSKLVLENVTWVQADYYQFTDGAITWKHENAMCGDAIFVYQTVETSTICERSCVCLDLGFTFSYDPLFTGTDLQPQNLIVFNDPTSYLELNNATLWAVPGIELTGGTVSIKKNSTFVSATDTGITIGSGTSDDDCKILLSGGAQLTIAQGALNYKNIGALSWTSGNNLSTLYLADNTLLNIYQSLNIGAGGFLFGNHTMLNRAVGMDITGALTVQGELSFGGL